MPDYDLIIRQGTIVDGTQVPRFVGDLGIRDGVIAEVDLRTAHSMFP